MCGIAGIVSVKRADAQLVRRMCDVLAHRGPDGSGIHDSDHAALMARRGRQGQPLLAPRLHRESR
jgi:asparagine synthase (glutamine-hydrolysing)